MNWLAREVWHDLTDQPRLWRARLRTREPRNQPVVSIIIPTHNRVDLLMGRALESIGRQTWGKYEVIVAAHGCTDDTVQRTRTFADIAGLPILVIDVPRRPTYPPTAENHWFAGPVAPLNAALRACRGDWIARMDDDDIWTPDHLEKLLRFARLHDHEFVSAAHETHKGRVEPYELAPGVLVGGCQTWLYRSYLRFMEYNPECWRKPHDRVNDTDLQDRFWRAGVRMGYLNEVVARVLPRPGSGDVGLAAYVADRDATERQLAFQEQAP